MMNPIIDDVNYIDKTYYTFRDLLTLKLEDKETNDYMSLSATPLIIRTDFLGWRTPSLEVSNILNDEVTLELWEHLKSLNLDEYIASADKELKLNDQTPRDEVNKCFGSFYRLFEAILMRTYPRYKRLKTIYKANEENLLKQMETASTTKSRNNEIPQTSSVDPYDEAFANQSNVSENKSSSDPMPMMERLDSIRQKWYSIVDEWANQFDSLFIELI